MDLTIRKVATVTEEVYGEGAGLLATPLRLAAAMAVIKNPYAGEVVQDLSLLSEKYSPELGERLTTLAATALGTQATVFGKATLVGENGEVQHGSSIIHTKAFGDFQRAATKGTAVVPAAEKRGGVGATLDLSLRSAHDGGSLADTDVSQLFSWEVRVADAPHADEILVIVVLGDGGRPDVRKEA
ncbi:amino acid synthesis family protein [Mycolicibacterium palauense]|uniref:amino acid synthesis family protein n=1 Tax=Mycolicibacterium palauense TaxID=2034511 RepID=UPI00159BAFAA|nr:amino acid synthesis family protein [Mycolicibacterium palauense]